MAISEETYQQLVRNLQRAPGVLSARDSNKRKQGKYKNKRVTVGDYTFPSLLEAKCFTALWFQYKARQITEPQKQVPFSLGVHYGEERFYICDFTYVDLKTGQFVVVDAKGFRTEEYKRKKKVFECLYGIRITEYTTS